MKKSTQILYDKLVGCTGNKEDGYVLEFYLGGTHYTTSNLSYLVGCIIGVDKHGSWWVKQ